LHSAGGWRGGQGRAAAPAIHPSAGAGRPGDLELRLEDRQALRAAVVLPRGRLVRQRLPARAALAGPRRRGGLFLAVPAAAQVAPPASRRATDPPADGGALAEAE